MSGFQAGPAIIPWVVVFVATCVGVVTDLRARRLPNWLTFTVAVTGLGYAMLQLPGATTPVGSLLGSAFAGLPFLIMTLMRGSGAGDAKMMLALGLWVGPRGGFYLAICVAIAGGVLAIVYAAMRGKLAESITAIPQTVKTIPQPVMAADVENGPSSVAATGASDADNDRTAPDASATRRSSLEMPYALAICLGTVAAGIWMWVR